MGSIEITRWDWRREPEAPRSWGPGKCLGTWLSGSGAHKMWSGDCARPGVYTTYPDWSDFHEPLCEIHYDALTPPVREEWTRVGTRLVLCEPGLLESLEGMRLVSGGAILGLPHQYVMPLAKPHEWAAAFSGIIPALHVATQDLDGKLCDACDGDGRQPSPDDGSRKSTRP